MQGGEGSRGRESDKAFALTVLLSSARFRDLGPFEAAPGARTRASFFWLGGEPRNADGVRYSMPYFLILA